MREAISQRPGTALMGMGAMFVAVDAWGHITRAYVTSPIIDVVTHILFGAILALVLLRQTLWRPAYIFAAVMMVGLGWEFLEALYDLYVATPRGFTLAQHGAVDTVKDVVNNGIGALLSLVVFKRQSVSSDAV